MKSSTWRSLRFLTGILILATTLASTATWALSQDRIGALNDSGEIVDDIPAEALRTAEGRQLADRLRILRRSQASMGPKHPSYNTLQAEIDGIRARLGLSPTGSGESDRMALDAMSGDEMRQLIRRMALRIESLEKRVDALERRLEVF